VGPDVNERFVLCHLTPGKTEQWSIDLGFGPDEEVRPRTIARLPCNDCSGFSGCQTPASVAHVAARLRLQCPPSVARVAAGFVMPQRGADSSSEPDARSFDAQVHFHLTGKCAVHLTGFYEKDDEDDDEDDDEEEMEEAMARREGEVGILSLTYPSPSP
jgi:hypothetical protein